MSEEAPLDGVVVADFTHAVAGAYATMLLGDLGADVIKIERPGRGDSTRYMTVASRFADFRRSGGDYFLAINRNKRSVTIDLGCARGQELALEIVDRSDVLVQSFRPGVMERLGLGWEHVHARKESLVYASLSAYGPNGRLGQQPGMDVAIQARSGIMSITGYDGSAPVKAGVSAADFSGGIHLTAAILAALVRRSRCGRGQLVTTSLLDATMSMLSNYSVAVVDGDVELKPMGSGHPQLVPFQALETSDGFIVIAAGTNRLFRDLCRVLGCDALADDPSFATNPARVANRGVLVTRLEATLRTRSASHWLRVLEEAEVPCAPIHSLREAFADDEMVANGMLVALDHPTYGVIHVVNSPYRFDGVERTGHSRPPLLGEHTDQVLGSLLNLTEMEVAGLRADGVIGAREGAEVEE